MLDMLQRWYFFLIIIYTTTNYYKSIFMYSSSHVVLTSFYDSIVIYVIDVPFNLHRTHPHICIEFLLNLILVFIKIIFKEYILLFEFPILLYDHPTKNHIVQNKCLLNETYMHITHTIPRNIPFPQQSQPVTIPPLQQSVTKKTKREQSYNQKVPTIPQP